MHAWPKFQQYNNTAYMCRLKSILIKWKCDIIMTLFDFVWIQLSFNSPTNYPLFETVELQLNFNSILPHIWIWEKLKLILVEFQLPSLTTMKSWTSVEFQHQLNFSWISTIHFKHPIYEYGVETQLSWVSTPLTNYYGQLNFSWISTTFHPPNIWHGKSWNST